MLSSLLKNIFKNTDEPTYLSKNRLIIHVTPFGKIREALSNSELVKNLTSHGLPTDK